MKTRLYDDMTGCADADPRFVAMLNEWEKTLSAAPSYLASLRNLVRMYREMGKETEAQLFELEISRLAKTL